MDGVKREPNLTKAIIRSYARNLSTLAKRKSLLQDVIAMNEGCTDKTFGFTFECMGIRDLNYRCLILFLLRKINFHQETKLNF